MPSAFRGASWAGVTEVRTAFASLAVRADAAARANVQDASAYLVREAMNNFRGSHKRGEPHVSAGVNPVTGADYPNVVTGNLRRSIMSQGLEREGLGRYAASVGPTARYGRAVELGRPDHGQGAYPYFGPAVHQLRTVMPAIAAQNWAKYLES